MASTVSLKSQTLHNFSLSHLKWANNNNTNTHHRFRKSPPLNESTESSEKKSTVPDFAEKKSTESDGKTKILLRFRIKNKTDDDNDDVVADTVDQTSIAADVEEPEREPESEPKTWNLRPRSKSKALSPLQVIKTESNVVEEKVAAKEKKEKKRKLTISLSKEEIEEDILAMTGSKPTRRPKKRPKHVQKQLDSVFPGLWLGSITSDSYKVSINL